MLNVVNVIKLPMYRLRMATITILESDNTSSITAFHYTSSAKYAHVKKISGIVSAHIKLYNRLKKVFA